MKGEWAWETKGQAAWATGEEEKGQGGRLGRGRWQAGQGQGEAGQGQGQASWAKWASLGPVGQTGSYRPGTNDLRTELGPPPWHVGRLARHE